MRRALASTMLRLAIVLLLVHTAHGIAALSPWHGLHSVGSLSCPLSQPYTKPTLKCRTVQPLMNFFANLMKPQPTPADVYNPDMAARLPGLPKGYNSIYAAAAVGVQNAITAGLQAVEVDFPPLPNVNALNDGSAKSERLVQEANADAADALARAIGGPLGGQVTFVGCSGGARAALKQVCRGEVLSLRDTLDADAVAIVVQPTSEEQWSAVQGLVGTCRAVVVLNGLLNTGWLPHAYYYKPMTAFSAQTGGVVRQFPGPYACYRINGQCVDDLEIQLSTQGRRALPDTKDCQMRLQNLYGKR